MKKMAKVMAIVVAAFLLLTTTSYVTEPKEISGGTLPPKIPLRYVSYLNTTLAGQRISLMGFPPLAIPPGSSELFVPEYFFISLSELDGETLTWHLNLYVIYSHDQPRLGIGISDISVSGYLFNTSGNGTTFTMDVTGSTLGQLSPPVNSSVLYFYLTLDPASNVNPAIPATEYAGMNLTAVVNMTFWLCPMLGPFHGLGTEYHMNVTWPMRIFNPVS
ncbi:MAG: hypothetical protein M0Z77_10785 [Thermoplasmatales archaeon]|jgi:hypothetical protein|nr:hypothetical protein [Thermoplasmatales archaeon]